MIPTNQTANSKQYLMQVGTMLADSVAVKQSSQQRMAMQALGAYVQTVRGADAVSVCEFAATLGVSEFELTMLEQGLLPYAYLTSHFIQTLANACHEDAAVLLAILYATQATTASDCAKADGWADVTPRRGNRGRRLSNREITWRNSGANPFWRNLRQWYHRSQVQFRHIVASQYERCLAYVPQRQMPLLPWVSSLTVATVCCFLLIRAGLLRDFQDAPQVSNFAGTPTVAVAEDRLMPEMVQGTSSIDTGQRTYVTAGDNFYQIIYTGTNADVGWAERGHVSPQIPVNAQRIATIRIPERVPRILLHCRTVGHLESCPM